MSENFVQIASLEHLEKKGKLIAKIKGKQILLIKSKDKVLACNNRCPHQGFPLSEGSLSSDCVLTCNWHNWKFDLLNDNTLVGGDQLRLYPTRISGSDVLVDISDPPKETVIEQSLVNLKDSFRRQEYDRMAREISRMEKVGGDPLDAIRHAINWTHDRFEYGMTHAFAATADWIALHGNKKLTPIEKLVPILEAVGHMSWDCPKEQTYPFSDKQKNFEAGSFEKAIEDEDEELAVSYLNGALNDDVQVDILIASLAKAALAHYANFGHAAIYVYKANQLIERLGSSCAAPVLRSLIRSLVYASREDLLPEFQHYSSALDGWSQASDNSSIDLDFDGLNVNKALNKAAESAVENPERIYAQLLKTLARNMLFFKSDMMNQWENTVSNNISWLDFSHGLTFANAVAYLCRKNPELWPQGLLQMACFAGRNSGFVNWEQDMSEWYITDSEDFIRSAKTNLLDHGNPEFIVSSHLVKVISAVEEEVIHNKNSVFAADLLAATNRFLHSPFKRKHTRRVAYQALEFVAREG